MSEERTHSPSLARRLFNRVRRSRLGRIEWLTYAYRELVVRFHGSGDARVGEFRIRFDPRDRMIAQKLIVDGGYEQFEIDALCRHIRPGDVVLDVGANIGLYTLAMSRATGPNGTVVAFEPDPDNLRLLRHNVAANECRNVVIVPCGLDARDGERLLYQVDDNRGYLSFADLGGTEAAVRVPVRRGDAVLRELGLGEPDVVKIDVEGAEPLVLEGLGCRPRMLQLEFVPAQLRALNQDPLGLLSGLVTQGYELALIDRDGGAPTPMQARDILSLAERTELDYNVLAQRA